MNTLIQTGQAPTDYRRRMALELLKQGTSTEPILHWAQGLGRLGQAALGGYQMYQADQRDKEAESGTSAALIAALSGGSPGASMPSAQPTPQRPTASPQEPVSSVTPSAGAVPAALTGERPGGPVMPSAKVWGDKEAEAAGIYEKPAQTAALSPMVPTPVKTEAIQPASAPVPTPTDPQMADAKARLVQMLQSDNPQMRKLGQSMAQTMIASQLAGDKPTDDIREFQYGQKNPEFNKWTLEKARAKATNVTTNVGGGSDKQIFDAMDEGAKAARATAAGLAGLREAKQAIEGGAITGFRADDRLALQKAASFFGADPTKVANTETFKAAIAPQVAAVLKSTVGTVNISNTDREFAEKAAGGNINLDEKSISRLLDIMERASVGQLEAHQKRLDKVYGDPEKFGRERALFGVEMPAAPIRPPQAAAPKVNLKQKYGLD